jgi:hypothetical protein
MGALASIPPRIEGTFHQKVADDVEHPEIIFRKNELDLVASPPLVTELRTRSTAQYAPWGLHENL